MFNGMNKPLRKRRGALTDRTRLDVFTGVERTIKDYTDIN